MGGAVAERLAEEGAALVLSDISSERLEGFAAISVCTRGAAGAVRIGNGRTHCQAGWRPHTFAAHATTPSAPSRSAAMPARQAAAAALLVCFAAETQAQAGCVAVQRAGGPPI